jgi:L-proline amide hydrolase
MTFGCTEGFVSFRGLRTWYRVAGDIDATDVGKVPVLLLHGGPGFPSDPFESLEALASSGRPVIRYDQIGCGRSDRPHDPSWWTVETFVDELATVRRELGLDRVHLLGWSWGGMLALEYLLTRPDGIVSVVLTSTPPSIPLYVEEARRLRELLPEHVKRTMRRFEQSYRPKQPRAKSTVGDGMSTRSAQRGARVIRPVMRLMATPTAARLASWASAAPSLRRPAYEVAAMQWTTRHQIHRPLKELPLSSYRCYAGMNRELYETMAGPSEFFGTGTLRHWDVTDRLAEIDVPALITSGAYDEVTPTQAELLHRGIPGSQWVLFDHSAHCAVVEEPDRYRAVLEEFLATADPRVGLRPL